MIAKGLGGTGAKHEDTAEVAALKARVAALEDEAATARGMADMLYHGIRAYGHTSKALAEKVQTVERWIEARPSLEGAK